MERARGVAPSASAPMTVGRYAIFDAIASGGMATVHLGRLVGPAGFTRTVAIKRLHPQFAHDPDFTAMFLDEARLAARVHHPNVVPTLDVVQVEQELLLVMEYVRGEALNRLLKSAGQRGERLPPSVVVAILSGALQGLHAAHEALDEKGRPLGLVHRDMSPQNILVGADGTARVLDFGVAKAEGRIATTREGQIKGKILYMPPEQLSGKAVTRTADVYAVGVVLYETLTGVRMFAGAEEAVAIGRIVANEIHVPSEEIPELEPFDAIVRRATAKEPEHRFPTARDMCTALEKVWPPASAAEVAACVERLASSTLDDRARKVAEIESSTMSSKLDQSGVKASARSQARVPSRRTPRLVPYVIAGGVAAAIAATAYWLGARRSAEPVASPSAIVPEVSPPASEATQQPAPSAASRATAPVTAMAATTSPPPKPARPGPGLAKPKCDPPYTVDKNGHKHFIPECVR